MKKAFFWLVIVAILVLPVFGLEYYLRFIGLGDPIVYDADRAYGYAPRAKQRKERMRGAIVTINESGLRSTESWANQDKEKVLFVGDSVTWGGTRLDDTQVFPHLFCEIVNERFEEEKYTCGNAGVNAYGVLNMILRVKYDERINDAQTIVMTIFVKDFQRGWRNQRVSHYFLRENDVFFRGINEFISYLAFQYDINFMFAKRPDIEPGHSFEGIDFAVELLRELGDDLEASGQDLHIALTPLLADLDFQEEYDAYVLAELKKHFPDLILLSEPLRQDDDLFADRMHYSPRGHAAVAKYLAEVIPLGSQP